MNRRFIIREYKEGDEDSIMRLRGLVLSGTKDKDWWAWQCKRNPAGNAIITIAVDEAGQEIVGHIGHIPRRVKVGDEICLLSSGVDAMVHPDYRRLSVSMKMSQKNTETAIRNNIQFSYSYPNKFSYYGVLERGGKTIYKKSPLWIKPLRPENIVAGYFKKNSMLYGLFTEIGRGFIRLTDRLGNYTLHTQVREVKEIDDRFDNLWQKASRLHKIMLVRDKSYLDWRYIKKPDADYTVYISEEGDELLGYIVLRSIENSNLHIGYIADVLTDSADTPASIDLVKKAIQHFKLINTDIILCVLPTKAYIAPVLRKYRFLFVSKWRRGIIRPITIRRYISRYSESLLSNADNWFLTKGDSDVI